MKNFKLFVFFALFPVLFTFFGYEYLRYKEGYKAADHPLHALLEFYESVDLRYTDLKFKLRGQSEPQARVALIAIDDDSIREVGRWPWNRDIISQITKNAIDLGVTSMGFDVIFSEPDRGFPHEDAKLGETVAGLSDRVVLGAFSESQKPFEPYQDYCVNEAFLANGGDQLVKLNPTMAIDDAEDPFDTLKWNGLFNVLFANVKVGIKNEYLRSLNKKDEAALTTYQKNFLSSAQSRSLYDYCRSWLSSDDPFKIEDSSQVRDLYTALFSDSEAFKGLTTEQAIAKLKAETKAHLIPEHVDWTSNIPVIQGGALYTANFNATLDPDGYVRRYPLFFRSGNRLGTSYIPSLAFQTYLIANKYRAEIKLETLKFGRDSKGVTSFKVINPNTEPESIVTQIPTDPMGRIDINYYGRQMTFPYVSAKELLSDEPTMKVRSNYGKNRGSQLVISEETVNKKEFFKDRSVIFGATAEALYDLRNTPLESNYPGPEVHLTVLANLLENKIMSRAHGETLYITALILLLGLSLAWIWSHRGAVTSFAAAFVVTAAIFGFDYYLFTKKNILTTNILLLTLVVLCYFGTTIFKYFTEERKKKELKTTFSKYVSPAIVDEILQQPENLKLGGRKQRMTVMFSDVRGFTTISEKLPPVELAQLLNDYLTPMTDLVFENKGTLDKYMGDAIMAFFGAPIFYDNHAAMACRCALRSLDKLAELQKEFAARNLPMIDIGIGINTGEMSVGNMGSNIVQSYTVMGDSVNLGSRLEGINKEYGTRIIVSEFTYGDLNGQFMAREVDWVRVKGKKEPVRIFEIIKEGAPSADEKSWLTDFEAGYAMYHKRDFGTARGHFESVLRKKAGDPVAELYVERCTEFTSEPPPADWDGVYVMKTK